jgi:hypothetical protein
MNKICEKTTLYGGKRRDGTDIVAFIWVPKAEFQPTDEEAESISR